MKAIWLDCGHCQGKHCVKPWLFNYAEITVHGHCVKCDRDVIIPPLKIQELEA